MASDSLSLAGPPALRIQVQALSRWEELVLA